MKTIPLSQGQVTKVDDEDYDWLINFPWRLLVAKSGRPYAVTGRHTLMHRLLMQAKKGFVVDHKNRDSLDNRRTNLRVCTYSQNMANAVYPPSTSKHKGVSWCNKKCKWRAALMHEGRFISLGYHVTEEDAAKAYIKKATELFGEFARA